MSWPKSVTDVLIAPIVPAVGGVQPVLGAATDGSN